MSWELIYLPQIIKNHSSVVGIVTRPLFPRREFPRNFLQSLGAYIVWVLSCIGSEALHADWISLSRPKSFYHEMLSILPEFNLHEKSCQTRHRAPARVLSPNPWWAQSNISHVKSSEWFLLLAELWARFPTNFSPPFPAKAKPRTFFIKRKNRRSSARTQNESTFVCLGGREETELILMRFRLNGFCTIAGGGFFLVFGTRRVGGCGLPCNLHCKRLWPDFVSMSKLRGRCRVTIEIRHPSIQNSLKIYRGKLG